MHIIFGNVTFWQIPILKILNFFNFRVYYHYINAKTDTKKHKIASKLKESNILPLPLEFEKKLLTKSEGSLGRHDYNELYYKTNLKLIPDEILKK